MRTKCKGKSTVFFADPPRIISGGTIVGDVEAKGPLGSYFDIALEDDTWGEGTWEKAERKMFEHAVRTAVEKGGLTPMQVDILLGGDLLNQIISANFAARELEIPFLGLYGACSTMGEALSLAAMTVSAGYADNVIAMTSSHFGSAEKQFRFPLDYGNQRPLCATWTVTGAGGVILSASGESDICVSGITTGRIVDYGIQDSFNMGAAMAPAACDVIYNHLMDFERRPEDYDAIYTGDLGSVGQTILIDLMDKRGFDISKVHHDCGVEIYDAGTQDTHAGGSGCGCSAATLSAQILRRIREGEYSRVLFVPTGALLSAISFNEGKTVPGIAHAVVIEKIDRGGEK